MRDQTGAVLPSRLLVLVAVLALAAVGCADDDDGDAAPGATTGPATTAAPSTGGASPVTTVPVDTRAAAAEDTVVLPCEQSIAAVPAPPGGFEVVLGAVALPTATVQAAALQTAVSGEADPDARLFAKTGLLVLGGADFEVIVPDDARPGFSVGWGSPAVRSRAVSVACDAEGWLAFAGGYWVSEVGCRALLVRSAAGEQTVEIGVGAPCAGQDPPPEPSAT